MANKRLNAVITIGGAVSSTLGAAFGSLRGNTTKVGAAIKELTGRQKELSRIIKEQDKLGAAGPVRAQQELAIIGRQIEALKKRQAVENRIAGAQRANIARRGELRGQMFDVVAIGAAILAPVKAATTFENAMLGVAKQVDGARDSAGRLTPVYHQMALDIKSLAREIPMTTTALAEMVTAGARMGIARDQLLDFTRTSAMMAEAFEADPGELAEQMGKIAGLYKIPIPAISGLGDAINWLDDNAISKGADIISFLTRTGGVAGAVKITGTEMAALGSTLLTMGERTETAGTAVNAMIQKFAAADKGTAKFRAALRDIGLTPTEVQMGMQTDAQGTIMRVMDAIGSLPAESRLGIMVDLIGLEHSDTLAKLAGNMDEYRRQVALAHSEESKGSMSREFAARLETTGAQAQLAANRVRELAINIGSALLPGINSALNTIGPLVSVVADLAARFPRVTSVVVGAVVGLGALRIATLVGAYAFTFLRGGVLGAMGMFYRFAPAAALAGTSSTAAAGGATLLGRAMMFVGRSILWVGRAMLLNPIGLAVTAIAGAAILIYKYWEPIKDFFANLWGGVKATFASVFDWIVGKFGVLMNLPGAIKSRIGSAFSWFTGDDETTNAASESAADIVGPRQSNRAGLPDVPAMAQRGGSSVTDNSQTTITIQQQPGQDPRALVDEIERRRRQQGGIRARSLLLDGVGAQ